MTDWGYGVAIAMTLREAVVTRGALIEALQSIEHTSVWDNVVHIATARAFNALQTAIAIAQPSLADTVHPDGPRIAYWILEEVRRAHSTKG